MVSTLLVVPWPSWLPPTAPVMPPAIGPTPLDFSAGLEISRTDSTTPRIAAGFGASPGAWARGASPKSCEGTAGAGRGALARATCFFAGLGVAAGAAGGPGPPSSPRRPPLPPPAPQGALFGAPAGRPGAALLPLPLGVGTTAPTAASPSRQ